MGHIINPVKKTYNPHFHLIVPNKAIAELEAVVEGGEEKEIRYSIFVGIKRYRLFDRFVWINGGGDCGGG